MTASPLAEFWRFAADFHSVTALMAKAMVAAPFVDLAINIGPPWPSRVGLATFISIVQICVLMYSFEFWRVGSRRDTQNVLRQALLIGAVLFLAYLVLFGVFVVEADDLGSREIIGYAMHGDVADMVSSNPSKWTPKELLIQFHDVMEVWTPSSVRVMRILIVLVWLSFWLTIGAAIAAFVSARWKDAASAERRVKSSSKNLG